MFLTFPNFNIYSTPLLVLVSQGFIFGILLLSKYLSKKQLSHFFLALLVLITCYHRTTYTIGFMDWYDTFRNTKINYWLIHLVWAVGPLIYFYTKSVTTSDFKFRRKDLLHFLPAVAYLLYRIIILIYDASQSGFNETQNGVLMSQMEMGPTGIFIESFSIIQQLLYLAFTLQLYFNYRRKIKNYFSNAYSLELNWIRNFLFIYTFLFGYYIFQQLVNITIFELNWMQKWWYQFFSVLAVVYIGIKGYFTDTSVLNGLDFKLHNLKSPDAFKQKESSVSIPAVVSPEINALKTEVKNYMGDKKPYLNPDLNLQDLASSLNLSRAQLSEVINLGFQKNFNDFVNGYRVKTFKEMLSEGKQKQLSLLGIAYECGFNSKATFNRVFKKLTNFSPTEYLKSIE